MSEIGEGPSRVPHKKTVIPKPEWKQTADEILALKKAKEEAVRQELYNRSKELLVASGAFEAGLYVSQQLVQLQNDVTAVRFEVGYNRKLHPALIIRYNPQMVQTPNKEFVGWKSQGVRLEYDPGTGLCAIHRLSREKNMWVNTVSRRGARHTMNHEDRSLIINSISGQLLAALDDSDSYFELGRTKDKYVAHATEKRFRAIAITGNNAGNFVQ